MSNAYIVLMAENREVTPRYAFPVWIVEQDGKRQITPGLTVWEYKHDSVFPIEVTGVRLVVDDETQFDYPIQLHTVNGVIRPRWFSVQKDDKIEFRVTIPEGEPDASETTV